MTPAAIRVAEGRALDAFVLERVCGEDQHRFGACLPQLSSSHEACWRLVVPAMRSKGYGLVVMDGEPPPYEWKAGFDLADRMWVAVAPTPALAIVRAAALTVAEGGE